MARILYAVNGDGLGHATRAHSVASALLQRGHSVRFLASLKSSEYLGRVFPGLVDETFGLCLSYHQGRAHAFRSVVQNIRRACSEWSAGKSVIKLAFRRFKPDLLVTDFEPLTAYYARRFNVPFVSLDNQHLLTHCRVERPGGAVQDSLNAYATVRLYYGGARRYLIPTFIRAPVRFHPATVIDPILRPEVYDRSATVGDFLLAYKGAGGDNDHLKETLESYDRLPIRAYGFGVAGQVGRVSFKANSVPEFLDDLSACAGVVMSAGHSLACECLHLEKPMLLTPVARQYEQSLNAYHVEKLGAGVAAHRVTREALDGFVDRLDDYRAAAARVPKARLEPVVDAVERELP